MRIDLQGVAQPRVRLGADAGFGEFQHHRFARRAPRVDPQHWRRRLVVTGENVARVFRPITGQRLGQPAWVRKLRRGIAIEFCIQTVALAQPAPQHRVGEFRETATLQRARGFHGGRHRRMRRQVQDFELHQAQHQQGVQRGFALAKRLLQQPVQRLVEAQPPARALVAQCGQERAIARIGQLRLRRLQALAQRRAPQRDVRQHFGRERAGIGHSVRSPARAFR